MLPATRSREDLGTWTHLAGVYDGTAWRLYRNGVAVAAKIHRVGAVSVNANWAIGARSGGQQRFFDGLIDELAIYGRALSAVEIQAVYYRGAR